MTIRLERLAPVARPQGTAPLVNVVTAGIPAVDGCKVFSRLQLFAVAQGTVPILEFTLRNSAGQPLDLSPYLSSQSSGNSASASASISDGTYAEVRVKEILGRGAESEANPRWKLNAYSPEPISGVLRVQLPDTLTAVAGVYELSWALLSSTKVPLTIKNCHLVVERSQYAPLQEIQDNDLGPPTLAEIRQQIMDSAPAENPLLDDVQFDDSQIVHVLKEPVVTWNTTIPHLSWANYTTRNFPYRSQWLRAVAGHLHLLMANHFRRNRAATSGGGVMIDDKNKETEYMREGQRLLQEYDIWVTEQKIALNTDEAFDTIPSAYSGLHYF